MIAARQALIRGLTVALALMLAIGTLWAQEANNSASQSGAVMTTSTDAATINSSGEAAKVSPSPGPGAMPGQAGKPGEQPGPAGGPQAKPGGPPGKPGDQAKPDAGRKSISRPSKPRTPPNPAELKIRPDKLGKVTPNFKGQPWEGVLDWLAEISGMSLDWRDLPDDYLNLSTRESYTVPEIRDLINRHLLARGYTMLRQGEMLTVVDIKKLDPSMVPRLEPGELDRHDLHEFAKVSFPLDWLVAETAATELKPMLSPNGKLTPLEQVNRIEAMDAVTNLRDMYALLKEEQSPESQQRLVHPFKLKYARASEVRDQLQTLLGLDAKSGMSLPGQPQNADQAQQQAMLMAKLQQQQQGGSGKGPQPGPLPTPQPAVTLAVNDRENTILVHAPPDKMAIIAQAIEAIDVPNDQGSAPLASIRRWQVHRVVGIDPEPLVKTLQQIGNLDPATRLEVDKKNKAILAYASLIDQVTIRTVVERLSGSERKFEVKRLRRLPADYVAGTIEFMMGVAPKKEKKQQNPWYGPFNSGSQDKSTEAPDAFRVDADVEHNRLLLWANDIELADVENLLVKLGEIPGKGENAQNVRVIEGVDEKDSAELLDRLRRTWSAVSPNPLLMSPAQGPEKAEQKPTPRESLRREEMPSPTPPAKNTTSRRAPTVFRLAELRQATKNDKGAARAKGDAKASAPPASQEAGRPQAAKSDRAAPSLAEAAPNVPLAGEAARSAAAAKADRVKSPPPVKVTIGPDGKLIISSEDTQALDMLEEMAAQLATPRKDYTVYRLKYAWAYGVSLNLQDYFKDDEKKQTGFSPWWWGDMGNTQDDSENDRRLSKRKKLKFISDSDTNSILVEGATADQLKTIGDLINLYDQPPPADSQSVRKTEVIHLDYAKAKVVADTVKDVYRDLLSANDKALADVKGSRDNRTNYVINYGGDSGASDKGDQKVPKFKGLLSIGVDENSNSLAISAPAYLFDPVVKMVKDLDVASAPDNTVRVMTTGSGISPARLQELLVDALGDKISSKSLSTRSVQGNQGPQRQSGSQGRGGKQQSSSGKSSNSQSSGNRGK